MTKQWMRMINSAQRVITLKQPKTTNMPGLRGLKLNIQGLEIDLGAYQEFKTYHELAAHGIRRGWAKPLSIFQRLRREQAPVGWLEAEEETQVKVSFWWPSPLTLFFDLTQAQDAILWRETEIMVMSAGFHFLIRELE